MARKSRGKSKTDRKRRKKELRDKFFLVAVMVITFFAVLMIGPVNEEVLSLSPGDAANAASTATSALFIGAFSTMVIILILIVFVFYIISKEY